MGKWIIGKLLLNISNKAVVHFYFNFFESWFFYLSQNKSQDNNRDFNKDFHKANPKRNQYV